MSNTEKTVCPFCESGFVMPAQHDSNLGRALRRKIDDDWAAEVQRICEFASTARNMNLRDQRNNLEDIADRLAKLHAAMTA